MTMSKVLGICASPRKDGNTDILVHKVLEGAASAGHDVEFISLHGLNIAPCFACGACKKDHVCIHNDDMPALIGKIREADAVVLGTPVYYWGPTAQMKAFTDRWHCDSSIFRGKTVIMTIPMEDTDVRTGRHVIGMYQDALDYIGASLKNVILAAGAYKKGDVLNMPVYLDAAYNAGKDI